MWPSENDWEVKGIPLESHCSHCREPPEQGPEHSASLNIHMIQAPGLKAVDVHHLRGGKWTIPWDHSCLNVELIYKFRCILIPVSSWMSKALGPIAFSFIAIWPQCRWGFKRLHAASLAMVCSSCDFSSDIASKEWGCQDIKQYLIQLSYLMHNN